MCFYSAICCFWNTGFSGVLLEAFALYICGVMKRQMKNQLQNLPFILFIFYYYNVGFELVLKSN